MSVRVWGRGRLTLRSRWVVLARLGAPWGSQCPPFGIEPDLVPILGCPEEGMVWGPRGHARGRVPLAIKVILHAERKPPKTSLGRFFLPQNLPREVLKPSLVGSLGGFCLPQKPPRRVWVDKRNPRCSLAPAKLVDGSDAATAADSDAARRHSMPPLAQRVAALCSTLNVRRSRLRPPHA